MQIQQRLLRQIADQNPVSVFLFFQNPVFGLEQIKNRDDVLDRQLRLQCRKPFQTQALTFALYMPEMAEHQTDIDQIPVARRLRTRISRTESAETVGQLRAQQHDNPGQVDPDEKYR